MAGASQAGSILTSNGLTVTADRRIVTDNRGRRCTSVQCEPKILFTACNVSE